MNSDYHYPGDELILFEQAKNWKKYFRSKVSKAIRGNVLEVGAGIGGTTRVLNDGSPGTWVMLEPDAAQYATLVRNQKSFPSNVTIVHGTLADVNKSFDTILYVDVLEHIQDDRAELNAAGGRLNRGGHLVVLSPAFQMLFSEFDKSIGHFRRYRKQQLKNITPAGLALVSIQYLDTAGFMASAANKLFLHQQYPSVKQVRFWDKWLVRVSKITDHLFLHLFGKTVIAIWEKQSP